MKKYILSIALLNLGIQFSNAQSTVIDTVTLGAGYANNVWHSLKNDDQANQPATNWDLAFAASFAPNAPLVTSILFNHKQGSIVEVPNSDPADFATIDTTGYSTWSHLFNSDTAWKVGALNTTQNLGQFDYGWGTYNTISHNIEGNRVFIIRYVNGTFKKFHVSMLTTQSKYVLVISNLDNSNLETKEIDFSNFASKNYIYYSAATNAIIDREPASASWDLFFGQYMSSDYNPPYQVTGVLHNVGVQVAKVYPVNNVNTYDDWNSANFQTNISTVGYNWKTLNQQFSFDIADSTVYFVQAKDGQIWKVIFTGFVGSAAGQFMFSKQQLTSLSISENEAPIFVSVYPNPSTNHASVVVSQANQGKLVVVNALGQQILSETIVGNELQTIALETSNWQAGLYTILVQTNGKTATQKLIVQ